MFLNQVKTYLYRVSARQVLAGSNKALPASLVSHVQLASQMWIIACHLTLRQTNRGRPRSCAAWMTAFTLRVLKQPFAVTVQFCQCKWPLHSLVSYCVLIQPLISKLIITVCFKDTHTQMHAHARTHAHRWPWHQWFSVIGLCACRTM